MSSWQWPSHIMSHSEWMLRLDLACAYRIAHHRGWDELIYNHITLRCPSDLAREIVRGKRADDDDEEETMLLEECFFINSFGLTFDEVDPLNLLLVSFEGTILHSGYTGAVSQDEEVIQEPHVLLPAILIHSALHRARPDLQAIWHCHATPVVAIASCECGLVTGLSQESVIVAPWVSDEVHAFEGVVSEPGAEQLRIAESLGQHKQILLMANHGVVSCGRLGLCDAFYNLHLLVRACEHQMAAMTIVGGNFDRLHIAPDSVVRGNSNRMVKQDSGIYNDWGQKEWQAMKRQTIRRLESLYGQKIESPVSVKLKSIKLLILHGFAGQIGSAEHICSPSQWLRHAMQQRGYEIKVVEPRAPTATEDGNGVAWIAGSQVAAGKVCGFYQRGWAGIQVDSATLDRESRRAVILEREGKSRLQSYSPADLIPLSLPHDNIWIDSRGYAESLSLLDQIWSDHNGFDGILGFSQGALMASLFLAFRRYRNKAAVPTGGERPGSQRPRFAILCGGFARPWPTETRAYWATSRSLASCSLDLSDCNVEPEERLLPIPSLHVIGEHDTVVAPCRSYELCAMFEKSATVPREVYVHNMTGTPPRFGGHVLPWTSDFHDKLSTFLGNVYAE